MLTSDELAPHTSAPSSSATRVSSAWAPDIATPSPMMMIGRVASARSVAAWSISGASGTVRVAGIDDATIGSSLMASRTSAGRATKTGPVGAVPAILIARRRTRSTEPGSTTRVAHFVTGLAIETRSAAIWASIAS